MGKESVSSYSVRVTLVLLLELFHCTSSEVVYLSLTRGFAGFTLLTEWTRCLVEDTRAGDLLCALSDWTRQVEDTGARSFA